MPVETIMIQNGNWQGERTSQGSALALVEGLFAVHPDGVEPEEDFWIALFTLTHVPTGYAIRSREPWRVILETLREIQARSDLDWSFTDAAEAKLRIGPVWKAIKAAADARCAATE